MGVSRVGWLWIATPVTKYWKRIRVLVSTSLPEEEQFLLGLPQLEHLHLLPRGWPEKREADIEEEEAEVVLYL